MWRPAAAHLAALNPVGMPIARWAECVDMQLSPPEGSLHREDKRRADRPLVHVNHGLPPFITGRLPDVNRPSF